MGADIPTRIWKRDLSNVKELLPVKCHVRYSYAHPHITDTKYMRGQQTGAECRPPDDASSFAWLLTSSFNKQAVLNLQHAAS